MFQALKWTEDGELSAVDMARIIEAMDNEKSINRDKYIKIRNANLHKMNPIPVCKIPK